MPIVDSHCHASDVWYEPIEMLLAQMAANGVEQAVLVQINGELDNRYQAECVRRYPGRFASVVLVDHTRADAPAQLERLAADGASGLRLPPGARSPGDDPLLLWRTAERLGLAVTSGGSAEMFAAPGFAEVLAAVPRLPIVIEHLGAGNRPEDQDVERRRAVYALARFPNAYLKIHGLGEFATRALPVARPFPFVRPLPPFFTMAYDAFGPNRLMWGSDYPPVSGREGYRNALRFAQELFADRPPAERDQIFGGVAARIFPVR